jgi:hypothetical protein
MTTSSAAPRSPGRIFRALAAYSAHTAQTYRAVWSPDTQRVHRPRPL